MRLGEGELTTHFRRDTDTNSRKIECGVRHGCVTAVLDDVTCKACRTIARTAKGLATLCGCRRPEIHAGVARAQYEIKGHRS